MAFKLTLSLGLTIALSLVANSSAIAQGRTGSAIAQPRNSCPTEIETLTPLMLRDLPGYANRVRARSRILNVPGDRYTSSILLAGRAEFDPLPLSPLQTAQIERERETTQQVFFTTLERHFTETKAYNTQNYHWLFLTKTESGWRLALIFTQFGSSDPQKPPLPPRETQNGIVGQGIQIWLRDCRAGAISDSR